MRVGGRFGRFVDETCPSKHFGNEILTFCRPRRALQRLPWAIEFSHGVFKNVQKKQNSKALGESHPKVKGWWGTWYYVYREGRSLPIAEGHLSGHPIRVRCQYSVIAVEAVQAVDTVI